MTDAYTLQSRSDPFGILALFRSDLPPLNSERSDRSTTPAPAGPTGPTADNPCRTGKERQNQCGPTGPTVILPHESAANPPDPAAMDLLGRYAERAAIREYDGGQLRAEAETAALAEVAQATGVTPGTMRQVWAKHPDAVAYLAHLSATVPKTCDDAASEMHWSRGRAWQAVARLRAAGLVQLNAQGHAEIRRRDDSS